MSQTSRHDSIGARIRCAREAMNLSTAQLARRLGVQTRTLAGWEAGRTSPRVNRVVNLAGLLGASATWLLSGHGDAPKAREASSEFQQLCEDLAELKEIRHMIDDAISVIDGKIADEIGPPLSAPYEEVLAKYQTGARTHKAA